MNDELLLTEKDFTRVRKNYKRQRAIGDYANYVAKAQLSKATPIIEARAKREERERIFQVASTEKQRAMKRPINKTKKSNHRCWNCKYYNRETFWCIRDPRYLLSISRWKVCSAFEWKEAE